MLTARTASSHCSHIGGAQPRFQALLRRRLDMVGSDRFPGLPGVVRNTPSTTTATTATTMASVSFLPGSESRKGCLVLVMGARRTRLQVSVYDKTLDPFVVFYPDKKHCRHCGVLKLKGCRVEPVGGSDTDFRVIPKSGDGGKVMVLGAESRAQREDWMAALTAPLAVELGLSGRPRSVSLRQQRMPSLPEIDEICSDSSDLEEEEEEEEVSCHGLGSQHRVGSSTPPRSRHEFIHSLDKFGRRPRCCTVHTSAPAPHDCDRPWDAPRPSSRAPVPNAM